MESSTVPADAAALKPSVLGRARETLLVVFGAVVLFAVLGEGATRLLNRDGRMYDIEMFRYSRLLKKDAPPEAAEMHHWHWPSRSAVLQGIPVTINSKGLRDYEYDYARKPGVRRILALGDSITFGWGVKAEDTYPKVLERLLNKGMSRDKFEVINCGVGNYTTRRILGLYNYELHKYSPDIVTLAFFLNNANDTSDATWTEIFDTPLQFPVFLWSRLQRVTSRYSVSRDFDSYYRDLYDDSNPMFIAFRDKLRQFLKQLAAEGRSVCVISIPDCYHLEEKTYRYQYVTDKVFKIAQQEGARTVDLFASVQGMASKDIMNTPEDRHPNAEGHRRMGESLYRQLAALNIVGGK